MLGDIVRSWPRRDEEDGLPNFIGCRKIMKMKACERLKKVHPKTCAPKNVLSRTAAIMPETFSSLVSEE